MPHPSADNADHLLHAAASSRARGADAVRRPSWYAVALGLSMGLVLASFAVPGWSTTGIVLGAVVFPVALELLARQRTGGSPAKAYLEASTRGTSVAWALGTAAVAAASLGALKITGASWVVLPGALLVAFGTMLAARRVDSRRARAAGGGGA